MTKQLSTAGRTRGGAIALMIASALCFSAMQLSSSLCASIPVMEQVFIRNAVSLGMYAVIWKKGVSHLGTKKQQPALLAWSLCGFFNVFFLFLAARAGDQGSLGIIGRLSGFLVVLLAAVFLHEKVAPTQYFAVVLAIAGGAFTVSPSGSLWGDPFTLATALLSSLFNALASICLGLLKNKVHALTVAFHFSVVSMVLSAPAVLLDFTTPAPVQWLALIGIGVFGGLGQITQMWAYERAPVGEINIYGYSGILFSMLLGFLFLHEHVTAAAAIGGALVLAAGIWSYAAVGTEKPVSQKVTT